MAITETSPLLPPTPAVHAASSQCNQTETNRLARWLRSIFRCRSTVSPISERITRSIYDTLASEAAGRAGTSCTAAPGTYGARGELDEDEIDADSIRKFLQKGHYPTELKMQLWKALDDGRRDTVKQLMNDADAQNDVKVNGFESALINFFTQPLGKPDFLIRMEARAKYQKEADAVKASNAAEMHECANVLKQFF